MSLGLQEFSIKSPTCEASPKTLLHNFSSLSILEGMRRTLRTSTEVGFAPKSRVTFQAAAFIRDHQDFPRLMQSYGEFEYVLKM